MCYTITLGPYLPSAFKVGNALDFFVVLAFVLAALETCLLLGFWCFHLYLMLRAYTTIEFQEKRFAKEVKRNKHGVKIRDLYACSPYDFGPLENVRRALGPNALLWLLPTRWGMVSSCMA